MYKYIKYIDIYTVDKKFNVSEDLANAEVAHPAITQHKVGSKVSGSFSMMLYSIILYQFIYQMVRMHQGINDN